MSSKLVTRAMFGVDPALRKIKARGRFYWDLTTIILRRALLANVADRQRVLEIGTGEYGILAVFLAKKRKIDLTAVEIVPGFIDTSREIAKNNRVDIRIILSDMFENVDGLFDVIYWNLPYVPTEFGTKFYKIRDKNLAVGLEGWHGGPSGLELFDLFLKEAPAVLKETGRIIAGLNTYFVPQPQILEIIKRRGLSLDSVCGSALNPSKAFVITKKAINLAGPS
ncbi:MAG: methyltransferase [Candidatus Omnitrophica bacterium]|nr:methyltransferase [Candidatus Omnitrophota bacterium]